MKGTPLGDGLIDLETACAITKRSRRSLIRLYQRGLLTSSGKDEHGRLLFCWLQFEPLRAEGRPSELLAA